MSHVYPTNAMAAPSLHDVVVDAPMATMTDACWHPWSRPSRPSRSIFHVLREQGFATRLIGAFGMDATFDPHHHLRDHVQNLSGALRSEMGIDEFDVEDSAFACRTALAHDRDAVNRARAHVASWGSTENKHACFVNLLACQDMHKCWWSSSKPRSTPHVPTRTERAWMRDPDVAKAHNGRCVDDPRRWIEGGEHKTRMQHALLRAAMLTDYLRGERCENPEEDRLSRILSALEHSGWAALEELDAELLPLLRDALQDDGAAIVLCCTHPIGLYEHGARCELPWDSCLRSFMTVCTAGTRLSPGKANYDHAPCSLAVLPHTLASFAGVSKYSWMLPPPPPRTAVTVCIAPSLACRATVPPSLDDPLDLPIMWSRVVCIVGDRCYSVVHWWSIVDMARNTSDALLDANSKDTEARNQRLCQQELWLLPATRSFAPDAVFDMTTDPCETYNLVVRGDWLATPEAQDVRRESEQVLAHMGMLGRVRIHLPRHVHHLRPERVTVCSVQTSRSLQYGEETSTRSIHTQTDSVVHFARGSPQQQHEPYAQPRVSILVQSDEASGEAASLADKPLTPQDALASVATSTRRLSIAQRETQILHRRRNN